MPTGPVGRVRSVVLGRGTAWSVVPHAERVFLDLT